jgi:hypothetical protein
MSDLENAAAGFVNGSLSQWRDLVRMARNTLPQKVPQFASAIARGAGIGSQGVERSFRAIHYASSQGLDDAGIVLIGREATIRRYVAGKAAARTDKQVPMTWKVAPNLRDEVKAEVERIKGVLKLGTSDQFWEWWLSQVAPCTEDELRHSAGDEKQARVK